MRSGCGPPQTTYSPPLLVRFVSRRVVVLSRMTRVLTGSGPLCHLATSRRRCEDDPEGVSVVHESDCY
jgi:hypothetical protein